MSQYIAGLAGNETIVIFVLGVVLVMVELILFPGLLLLAVPGILMLGALLWAMVDYWPKGTGELSLDSVCRAAGESDFCHGDCSRWQVADLALAQGLGAGKRAGAGKCCRRQLCCTVVRKRMRARRQRYGSSLPDIGLCGTALTRMMPSGRVEIGGQRYEARCAMGTIERGAKIRVARYEDFDVVVDEVPEEC